jgi:hypothetical protein
MSVLDYTARAQRYLAVFFGAVDSGDADSLEGLLGPTTAIHRPSGTVTGVDGCMAVYRRFWATGIKTRHFISNVIVTDWGAKEATASSYFWATVLDAGELNVNWGTYLDRIGFESDEHLGVLLERTFAIEGSAPVGGVTNFSW